MDFETAFKEAYSEWSKLCRTSAPYYARAKAWEAYVVAREAWLSIRDEAAVPAPSAEILKLN